MARAWRACTWRSQISAWSARNSLGPASWPRLWAGREADADTLQPGLADAIAGDLAAIAAAKPHALDLPRGTIHADLFPDNAFFLGDTFSGAIDFYFACTDALAYDLAICLNAWAFEDGGASLDYNFSKGAALIAGYESVRPLEAAERAALPILCRGAALRFFLTRLVDWSSTPEGALVKPKNPLEYAGRLAFHRKVETGRRLWCMTRDWKQWLRLILAVLFTPILAAGLIAAGLAMMIAPDLVFRVMIDSTTTRPATLPEIMASLFGFGAIGGGLGVGPRLGLP